MSHLVVHGGRPLCGTVSPSANKNAVLPILCATLLTSEPVVLRRVPDITDVQKLLAFFRELGSTVDLDATTGTLRLHHGAGLSDHGVCLPRGMRSSIMLVPALLRRFGRARFEEVTGCTLGAREIDPHVEVFLAFGAEVEHERHATVVRAPRRFAARDHWLDYASVTTTENFVLCAAVARGRSRLVNAACEPHVQELCAFLAEMGARIEGSGSSRLEIEGVAAEALTGCDHTFADDYHEAATFLALGAITGGAVAVRNGAAAQFPLIDRTFAKFGVEVEHGADGLSRAHLIGGRLKVKPTLTAGLMQKVEAAPWPYVPADLLPIFVALGARSEGSVLFWNKVYEGALGWNSELARFGALCELRDPHRLVVHGRLGLRPACVRSPYIIRVAIALFMVAASIEGRSTILHAAPIRRAHPRFVDNLQALGAEVDWVADERDGRDVATSRDPIRIHAGASSVEEAIRHDAANLEPCA